MQFAGRRVHSQAGRPRDRCLNLQHISPPTIHLASCLQSPLAPTREILAAEGVLPRLVTLLGSPTSNVAESAAAVLACYCQGPAEQSAVAAADGVEMLVALLSSEQHSKQEAALEALAALSRGNADTSQAMLQHGSVVVCLLRAIKQGGTPHTRFVAAVCLANLSRNLPPDHMEHSQQVGCCLLPAWLLNGFNLALYL